MQWFGWIDFGKRGGYCRTVSDFALLGAAKIKFRDEN
jgi:hypothetical protein